jgi:hypothetical protein
MKIKKVLVRGSIGLAVGLPLALQLVIPTGANAQLTWGPVIIAASPDSGPASGGTTVTITGEDLTLATAVLFGNVPASYTIVSNTEVIATSPAESAGTVTMQVKDGPRLMPSAVDFTYS